MVGLLDLLPNNYEIDGAAMNDYMHGSAATAYPQAENISEFSVASTLPDASVARGAGGQIEATLINGPYLCLYRFSPSRVRIRVLCRPRGLRELVIHILEGGVVTIPPQASEEAMFVAKIFIDS